MKDNDVCLEKWPQIKLENASILKRKKKKKKKCVFGLPPTIPPDSK